jgi:hypothetical protein
MKSRIPLEGLDPSFLHNARISSWNLHHHTQNPPTIVTHDTKAIPYRSVRQNGSYHPKGQSAGALPPGTDD